jgi:hydrocephalus-inducing protein
MQSTSKPSATIGKTLSRKVARGPVVQKELTPSELLRITSLDTQQYAEQITEVRPARIIELLSCDEGQKDTGLDINEPIFQPYPSEVRFQSYAAFETYETHLTFRNIDRVTRKISIQPFESPFFKVIGPASSQKIAPGMDTTFRIQFSPDDVKDYSEDLVCISDREKFIVPSGQLGRVLCWIFQTPLFSPPTW